MSMRTFLLKHFVTDLQSKLRQLYICLYLLTAFCYHSETLIKGWFSVPSEGWDMIEKLLENDYFPK